MPKWITIIFGLVILSLSACQQEPTENLPNDYPAWVQEGVFYQIFPERFRNGDPHNDPDKASLLGSYPHDTTSAWQLSPWTSDWYALQPWEKQNGKGFAYNAQRRRYGGDIQGIIDKLDYLSELGINAIYLNPVFESPSLHKYDAATYIHIDDNFGPDPQKDRQIRQNENPADPTTWRWTTADQLFLDFLQKAHERQIKVIIDGVFNHVGIRHWAFLDVKKKGPQSEYADWFTIKSWDDLSTPQNEFDYVGWAGVKELPELKENEQGLIPPIKEHVFAVVERWMDPNGDGNPEDGIDGWRLDVAEKVDHDFWIDFRKKVKRISPKAYITGETFWEDWENNKLLDPAPWLQGDQFDGVMNYRWSTTMTHYFIDENETITASAFINRLQAFNQSYPSQTKFTLLNLMDSHDTDRLASNIVNPDLFYDKRVSPYDNPGYSVRKPNSDEWRLLKLIALFQMTYPGAPMIYYGTEAGMWGADDPDCRKPMVWPDMDYKPEKANISEVPRPVDSVFFMEDLFEYYKGLIQLRKQEKALTHADFELIMKDDDRDVFAFYRTYHDDKIMVIINNSDAQQNLRLSGVPGGTWTDLLSTKAVRVSDDQMNITVPHKKGIILKFTQ
ncbi:MAG: DUF3459 domain-containing protein [Caldithrix sp.]|nr:DUF3459 domain-containing protein [Caldithrix sp.]